MLTVLSIGFHCCWNCSCGDGSLGEPPKRGDGQCGNMRLLLRQQQRVRFLNLCYRTNVMIVILKGNKESVVL